MTPFKHILVPVDFANSSERAGARPGARSREVVRRRRHASARGVSTRHLLRLLRRGLAWPVEELKTQAKQQLDGALADARKRYSNVQSHLVAGQIWESILDAGKEHAADVMGTHGRRGISRAMLGSVAEKVVRHSAIPVLTVGPEPELKRDEHL